MHLEFEESWLNSLTMHPQVLSSYLHPYKLFLIPVKTNLNIGLCSASISEFYKYEMSTDFRFLIGTQEF